MKKIVLTLLVLLSSLVASDMPPHKPHMTFKMYQSVPMNKTTLLQHGKEKMFCPVCGMNLPMWYKTNHSATHNHHTSQYCSLHCLTEDLKTKKLNNLQVVDISSLKFINVSKAFYVVGSKKKGTMTMVSKYAFAHKKDAQTFMNKFGGKIMSFTEALKVSEKDFAKETKMIHKKQAMMAKKGKMMYTKMCQQTEQRFHSVAKAKAYLLDSKICGNIRGKKLHMIGMYLSGK